MKKNQLSQPLQPQVTSSETSPSKETPLWQDLTEQEQVFISGGWILWSKRRS